MKKKKRNQKEKLNRKVEVDVSGQIGDTKLTIFALSNGVKFALKISGKEKRKILQIYRLSKNRPKDFLLHFYITGLKILFSSSGEKFTHIILDREIAGHEQRIMVNLSPCLGGAVLTVKEIGHQSNAHNLAYEVFIGKKIANKNVTAKEFISEMGLAIK
ncbi:hypothetical protein HY085_02245 [Candidatus Gottesmanbacteria bacterium]|nr:hypothetical protein [Candidatus Gottesmanbacteria bacterium]